MTKFENPYSHLCDVGPNRQTRRVNSEVPTEDYQMLQRIRTERGTIQTTVNILLKKLFDELKRRQITDYTRADDFVDFVLNCHLAYGPGGSAAIRADAKTARQDVGRGTTRTHPAHSTATRESANVPRSGRGGQRGKADQQVDEFDE